jgi:hypothetical protein
MIAASIMRATGLNVVDVVAGYDVMEAELRACGHVEVSRAGDHGAVLDDAGTAPAKKQRLAAD